MTRGGRWVVTVLAVLALGLAVAWWLLTFERVERWVPQPPRGEAAYNPLYALKVALREDGSVALGGYSENEAVALPAEAMPLLLEFKGDAPVAKIRERLRTRHQADLGDEVLLELFHQRVLTEPGAA